MDNNKDKNKIFDKEEINTPKEESDTTSENKDYYVNVDGEDAKVDVKSDEEYSCLLNCLEGYYVYGIGREEDSDEDEDDFDEDGDDLN